MSNRLIGDYGVETDFYVAYVTQAKELLKGNLIIDQYRGPVYQIFLAVAGIFFKSDYYSAGKFLNVLCASISLLFISKIINSIFNRNGALFVVLLVAVNQIFWRYTYEPGTDMLFLVFYTSALYFLLSSKDLNPRNLLIAGILTGLAYLTRYTGISLILLTIIIFAFHFYKMKRNISNENINQRNKFLKPILSYIIPVFLILSAWGFISYQSTGYFFYNYNYQNTAYTVYKPDTMSKDEWTSKHQNTFDSMSDVVFRDFGAFAKRISKNFVTYFTKDIFRFFPKYIGVLAGLGLIIFLLRFKFHSAAEKYFFVASLIFYFQILLIFYSERFSLPLLPFYCFLIVQLFAQKFLQRFNLKIRNLKLFTIILFALVFLSFYTSYNIAKKDINNVPVEILAVKDNVEKLNEESIAGKSVMARKPHIAYYLNMNYVVMPYAENYLEFIQIVKNSNADYVFVSEKEGLISSNEDLRKNLLSIESPPIELEVITSTSEPVTILYKVKK
ncbi:MAG: glycosyltransferase family 39 protein [Ignavibacteria bacterium]|nr:glycosyltransferase family 39 protein [Ignavibacteria bacterium]